MSKAIIKVKGMNCGHCKSSVEKILLGTKGVKSAEVILKDEIAVVEFEPQQTNENQLINKINESGIFTASSNP
jgi:copper chaperone